MDVAYTILSLIIGRISDLSLREYFQKDWILNQVIHHNKCQVKAFADNILLQAGSKNELAKALKAIKGK